MTNPFSSPAAPGAAGVAPKIYELDGCLVAFAPRILTKANEGDNRTGYGKDAPRDRITTDIYLLETAGGQPITIGRSDPSAAPNHTVAAPARFTGVWMSSENIVRALAPGQQPLVGQMVLGRVAKSEVGNKPWNLNDVAGTPDMDKAIAIWSALQMGGATYNEPVPLAGAPAPANSVSYAPSPNPPQPTAWTVPPGAPTQPQFAAGSYAPVAAAPAGYPPPPVAGATPNPNWGDPNHPNGALPWQLPAAPPVPQPPAAPTGPPPHLQAQGWTATSWATLTPQQQAQVLAATPVA